MKLIKKIKYHFELLKMIQDSPLNVAWYKIVDSIMKFAVSVQRDGKPMLTKIALIDMSEGKTIGDRDMVSIWAGVGESNPIERLKHLKFQNEKLKDVLTKCSARLDPQESEDLLLNIKIILDTFE